MQKKTYQISSAVNSLTTKICARWWLRRFKSCIGDAELHRRCRLLTCNSGCTLIAVLLNGLRVVSWDELKSAKTLSILAESVWRVSWPTDKDRPRCTDHWIFVCDNYGWTGTTTSKVAICIWSFDFLMQGGPPIGYCIFEVPPVFVANLGGSSLFLFLRDSCSEFSIACIWGE